MQVQIVIDGFHGARLATDTVGEVRREQLREVNVTDDATWIKGSRFALLSKPWKLAGFEQLRVSAVQRHNWLLSRAYLLEVSLSKMRDHLEIGRAKKALGHWLAWATRSCGMRFVKVAQAIERHKDGILARIPGRHSNRLTERRDDRSRLFGRRAYGSYSAEALEVMIYRCHGNITLNPPLSSPRSTP